MLTALAVLYAAIGTFAVAMTLNEGARGRRHPALRALGIAAAVLWPVTLLALIVAARMRGPVAAPMGDAVTA